MNPKPTPAMKFLNEPVLIDVQEDSDHQPKALHLRRRWVKVAAIEDRWAIDDEWWRETPLSRTYYRVVVDEERMLTVFRDEVAGTWFQQAA